jgi:hypothetical protein
MSYVYVPDSLRAAGDEVRLALGRSLDQLTKWDFLRAWCSIIYLFPGLQPAELFEPDSAWPRTLKVFAAEAWRRFDAGELADDELHCYQVATARIQREYAAYAALSREKPWMLDTHFGA